MEIFGYFLAILIGISLGLIGGGGSILTVPLLVYLYKVEPILSTTYSLFIVGTSSLIGSIAKNKSSEIDYKTAILFGLPSILAVLISRKILLPHIPEIIWRQNDVLITKGNLMMILFAILMIFASFSMIQNKKIEEKIPQKSAKRKYSLLFLQGSFVGLITGFIGAGGGFLIIPALAILCKLPIKKAIGTSLVIIAANSLIGFIGDFENLKLINWSLLLILSLFSIFGILIGNKISCYINGNQLKKGFGWFILFMGVYIVLNELI